MTSEKQANKLDSTYQSFNRSPSLSPPSPCAGFSMGDNSSIKEEDMGYVEPEQLNLVVLRAATNNFSEENKLGEGGFGEVFKVHLPPCLFVCVFVYVC